MRHDVLMARVPAGDIRSRYVLETVLRDGAGLPLRIAEHAEADIQLSLGDVGEELRLAAADRPYGSSVPPMLRRTPREIEAIDLMAPENAAVTSGPLLSALFHVLAGSEEIDDPRRDRHERFAASESRLFAAGYDDAPFVDLWGEAIERAVVTLWPSVEPRRRRPRLDVSHDVDAPFRYRFQSPAALLKTIAGEVLRGRWKQAAAAPSGWARAKSGRVDRDPFNHFAWMMDQAEDVGVRCTFYVIAGRSGGRIDGDYELYHPDMMRLWGEILDRGHRIGVHPSYNSFRSLSVLERERDRVIGIHTRLGLPAEVPRVRMHYLRFDPAVTPGLLAAAGFVRDSTLGFADRSGFRRGTCRPFKLWDHAAGRALELVEHPLLAMDATLLAERYEHLDHAGVEERIAGLAGWCHRFGGDLTLLWHNNFFERDWHFSAYKGALRSLHASPRS